MRIAIVSDIHDRVDNLQKVFSFLEKEKIERIICCGDVGCKETVQFFGEFKGTVDLVKGNMDEGYWYEEDIGAYSNIIFHGARGEIEIKGVKIAFTHKPIDAQPLAKSDKYDIVFYGHTHQPWQKKIRNCLLINPGNCAGNPVPATFALCDAPSMKLELKIIENL